MSKAINKLLIVIIRRNKVSHSGVQFCLIYMVWLEIAQGLYSSFISIDNYSKRDSSKLQLKLAAMARI